MGIWPQRLRRSHVSPTPPAVLEQGRWRASVERRNLLVNGPATPTAPADGPELPRDPLPTLTPISNQIPSPASWDLLPLRSRVPCAPTDVAQIRAYISPGLSHLAHISPSTPSVIFRLPPNTDSVATSRPQGGPARAPRTCFEGTAHTSFRFYCLSILNVF